jgi:salicylate hydroxylase
LAQPGKVTHRAALLSELLKSVNEKSKHTNKKVVKIEEVDNGGVVIHFTDKSTFSADAVIGADGVRGFVRGHILGPNHPATAAKKARLWDCRILVPIAKAKELLGEERFAEDRQYGFIGNGGFIMHDVLDNGETVQCIISMPTDETWAEDEWSKPLDRTAIEKSVQEWDDSPLKKGIVQVMLENPDLKAYAQTHHIVDAPTFAKGCTCMMGDAAHAATPWQGSGASMAIEDAMVLETLLGAVKDVGQIDAAFRVYDQMRRDRTQGVVHSSFGTAQILCGVGEGTGLDPEKIREGLLKRWGPIYKLDMGEHKKEALEKFRAMV